MMQEPRRNIKIIRKSKTPLQRVESHLKTHGYKLYGPYQVEGVEWLTKKEKVEKTNPTFCECDICSFKIREDRFSKRKCGCAGNICQSCIETWSEQHDTCPYCRENLQFDIDTKIYGGLLCDEMGLGKTLQMISLIIGNPMKHTLVILPASLIDQWITEFGKFAPSTNIVINYGQSRPKVETIRGLNSCVVITTYGLARVKDTSNSVIHNIHWDRLILDECHEMRNPNSKVYKSIIKINATNKWGITGTPIQNYRKDLTSLFSFLGVRRARYSDTDLTRYVKQLVLRRTKKMVEKHNDALKLPELKINKIELEFQSKEEKDFYNTVRGECSKALKSYKFDPVHAFEVLLRLRQVSILPQLVLDGYSKKWERAYPKWTHSNTKLDSVINHISENFSENKEEKENVIVFCQFHGEMQYLQEKLTEKNLSVDCIDGSVPATKRFDIISRSKRTNNIDVLLVQINAGGTGLNLQHFNIVYFTSPSWNPALKDQAIARAHRIGQEKEVRVYMPLIKETIDHRIFELQQSKSDLFKQIIDIV